MDILGMHACLVEAVCQINRTPDLTFAAIRENVINKRHLVLVWNRVFIQLSIITNPTWECCRVGLGNNEGR